MTTHPGTTVPSAATGRSGTGWSAWLRPAGGWAMAGLCAAGGVLLIISAVIHLHLWSSGYRHIHIIGPLFLVQVVLGFALAVAVVALGAPAASAAGAGFAGGTVVGLLVSVHVGLFGFKDSLSAPYATMSLDVEIAALAVLILATGVGARRVLRARG